jgi:hypothetical protein
MEEIDVGHALQHLAGEVRRRAHARRRVVKPPRILPGKPDQFGNRLRGHRGVNHEQESRRSQQRRRRKIPYQVKRRPGVQARIDGENRRAEQPGITIRGGFGRDVGCIGAPTARAWIHDHLLAPRVRQFLPHQPGHQILPRSDHDAHGPGWVGLS